jgi:hypothetical protein
MNTESKNFIAELAELGAEVRRDKVNSIPAHEQKLHIVAHKLLQLERDLAVPGAGISDSARQQRILDMIADEDF